MKFVANKVFDIIHTNEAGEKHNKIIFFLQIFKLFQISE